MANAHSSIFRDHAVQQYMQRQERIVFLHLAKPPLFALYGILFGMFLLASYFAWCEEVPIYITGSGVTLAQNEHVASGKDRAFVLIFVPVSFHSMVHAGLPIGLQTGTGSSSFSGRIEKVEPGIVNPREALFTKIVVDQVIPFQAQALVPLWQSRLFGILVLSIGLVQIVILLATNHALHELVAQELASQGKAQGYVVEASTGIVTFKAAGAEHRSLHHWSNLFFDQLNASLQRDTLSLLVDTAMTILHTFSPLFLLWIGAMQVLQGSMQAGTMLALNALAVAFLTPLSSLVSNGQRLQLVHSHIERISDVTHAKQEQQVQYAQHPPRLTGQIRLEHVHFRYACHAPEILHDICVQIEPGQNVAIVGRTRSGKSTLGKLLLGLYLLTKGEILYDGFPLRDLSYQEVRSQFGVVMQEAAVFSGAIRQNIAFHDPGMSMERVIQAAEFHDDVMRMPMQYETIISEAGSALSGGQRQRLALARALAHTPAILLLDEATSSLDVVTEQASSGTFAIWPTHKLLLPIA